MEIEWLGDSHDVVCGYSKAVRRAIGTELYLLQTGEQPLRSRPSEDCGPGGLQLIERQKLTQVRAAAFFDVPRPKISKIQGRDLTGITIDYLVRMLAKTGGTLRYSFRQPPKRVAQARVRQRAVA